MEVKSFDSYSYFIMFINDVSRNVSAYVMKNKSDVLDIFKNFHALVEREIGKPLKCLRSDGGEHCSIDFDEYYNKHDIRHEKTISCTLQHNGVIEIMNKTLIERVRSMLSLMKLP